MGSLWSAFGFSSAGDAGELPDIFPMPILKSDFIETDVINIYAKILTDVIERTQGISEQYQPALWDNCLVSESNDGLVTMISKAMAGKKDLFIVWNPALKLIRHADNKEQAQIKADYEKQGKSSVGTYVSFKNYKRTDMVKLYSGLEYCSISSLNKNMNLSTAIQFKMNDLRASVSLSDSSEVKAQAKTVATALGNGKNVLLDAKDVIETAKPEMDSVDSSMNFINQKRSFYLGMPASYITGVQPKGLGDSGEGDAKAIERGFKNYYFSIVKPVVESIFSVSTKFKSEDFRQLTSSLEALKTFEITSDEYLSKENKTLIINKQFGLDDSAKGDKVEPVKTEVKPPAAAPPVK